MNTKARLLVASMLTAFSASAFADGLVIEAGTGQSVYDQMLKEIQAVCPDLQLTPRQSTGSLHSLDDILANKANVAFVQADVMQGRKMIENDPKIDSVRVFMVLYSAELHIIATKDSGVNKLSDAAGKKVGTYGGSYITARILLSKENIKPAQIVQYESEESMIKDLSEGKVDVAMGIAGQPAPWVEKLYGQNFKLVAYSLPTTMAQSTVYSPTVLRYPGLSSLTVPTVAVPVDLITFDYKSSIKVSQLGSLKDCVSTHIDDLKETTGYHPKWREVDPAAVSSQWPMFSVRAQSPASAVQPVQAAPAVVKKTAKSK